MHLKSSSLACLSDGVGASSLNCLLKLPRVSHFGTPQAPPRRATAEPPFQGALYRSTPGVRGISRPEEPILPLGPACAE